MACSNIVAYFIILTGAVTLHLHGATNIKTAAQAAQALEPVAGKFAFLLFSLGIVGTGLLGIPVLAGASAYAMAEALKWPLGLERRLQEAKGFYAVIAASGVLGFAFNLLHLNPIQLLFWSAAINGIIAVPIMVVLMLLASNGKVVGHFRLPGGLRLGGWVATLSMFAAVAIFAWAAIP
jgi:Mn2+/Fe2+ NRAMP family transporter